MLLIKKPLPTLNPIQLRLLEMFSWSDPNDIEFTDELFGVINKFCQEKVDQGMDKICQEKGIDQDTVEQMLEAHYRVQSLRSSLA
jgi:hypothetical protein